MGLTKFEALQILGLEEGCTEKEIRERFKKLALKWHPDKNFHNPDEAQKKFQVISAAYSRLISKDEDDVQITLGDIFSDFHRYYNPHAHVFCDCDICQDEWSGMDFSEIVGSDSDLFSDEEEDGLFSYEADDRYYADQLLRAFAERLYRNFNGPSRMARKARENAWEASVYKRKNISAEEASRNADELLKEEEKEKREAEKRRQKNKKKRDAKKKKKAKIQEDKSEGTNKSKSSEGIKQVSSVHVEVTKEEGACGYMEGETDTEDDEIDISSAFVARASKKNSQQTSQSGGGGAGGGGGEGSSSVKNKGTFSLKSNEEKENVDPGRGGKVNGTSTGPTDASTTAEMMGRSRQLAGLGNIAAKDGHFSEAVRRFTEAIDLYPLDHRYFGNRSFCFDYLQEYTRALEDAKAALRLDSSWPKGYYRQGRAYAGLKHLDEAEESYVRALQLDPNYKDAEEELFKIRLEQLNGMGFTSDLSEIALKEYKTVQAAIDAILAGKVTKLEIEDHSRVYSSEERTVPPSSSSPQPSRRQEAQSNYTPTYNHSGYQVPPRMAQQQHHQGHQSNNKQHAQHSSSKQSQQHKQEATGDANTQGRALWVGNINSSAISEGVVRKLFQQYGEVVSVRMLRERRCAFVNYAKSESAAEALQGLQGKNLEGCYLLLRYPENPMLASASGSSPRKNGPVNGNECYYWRTGGCVFGAKCRYRHIPGNRGIDLKKNDKSRSN